MKQFLITGGNKISGKIHVSGAKNSALPLLASSILTDGDLVLANIPHVSDISTMINILSSMGLEISLESDNSNYINTQGKVIKLSGRSINNYVADYELVKKMRASVLVLGPLLVRYGRARVSLPGGCAIGTRPIDMHIKALEKMGAHIEVDHGYIEAKADGKLNGAEINFEKVSVGATEHIMMTACLAKGKTIINNAALEPEVSDLAKCLIKMGAKIQGVGTSSITIEGVDKLHGATYSVVPDRIEAGTFAIAAAITDGRVILDDFDLSLLGEFKNKMAEAGVVMDQINNNQVEVYRAGKEITSVDIVTAPFPGFATDLQAQFMALMTIANGKSVIEERIFENRFMHVMELSRMGAMIDINDRVAIVKGVERLNGAKVMATDLRASVSLVLAALSTKDETIIDRIYHLERGYEYLTEKLCACNADIKTIFNA